MDFRTKLIRMLEYYAKILLATTLLLGLLFVLAILAESGKERISPINIVRDMLPGILATGMAILLASNFVATLYELDDWRDGARHILRGMLGQPTMRPIIIVSLTYDRCAGIMR
jgi:hypothetical protein